MSKAAEWFFLSTSDWGDRTVDPGEGYFFEKLPALGAVIRESAQNSLDAKDGELFSKHNISIEGPVRMRISMHHGTSAMPREKADFYLGGLLAHLKAAGIEKLPLASESMPFMVIEDFGTVGLVGDARTVGLGGENEDNRFYWFHRNTNRTQARKKRGGSFGYGKASFAEASKLKSFLTVSKGIDGTTRVFGNSIAKTHEIEGITYKPYGDFGHLEEREGEGRGIVPVEEIEFFDRICEDFRLSRREGTGLSVIVPFPKENYSEEEILQSFIRNYFLPICRGDLVVEVSEPGSGRTTTIDSANIEEYTGRMSWSGKIAGAMTTTSRKSMVSMVKLASSWVQGSIQTVDLENSKGRNPYWYPELIPEELYGSLRSDLEAGRPIAVKSSVEFYAKKRGGKRERYPKKSEFVVLIRRDGSLGISDAVWIRRYISVPKREFKPKEGYISIVVSEDGELEELLRISEEVAHTEHRAQRVSDKYLNADRVINFYRKSASQIIEYLTKPTDKIDDHWLDDWFQAEEPESELPNKPKKRKKRKKSKGDEDVIVGPDSPPEDLDGGHDWDLERAPGGFSIEGMVRHDLDYVFTVKVGYARDDGSDPFKKWKEFDFSLDSSQISIESDGASIVSVDGNRLSFKVEGPVEEYYVTVSGFDTDRDLKVHARPRYSEKVMVK